MHEQHPLHESLLTRRSVLAASLLAPVVLGGCRDESDQPPASTSSGAQQPTKPPDDDVVRRAGESIAAASLTCRATAAKHPDLARVCRDFESLHTNQLAVLDQTDATGGAEATRVSRRRPAAQTALLASESALSATLTELALVADSGELARVLASMSAGLLQRLAR